MERELYYLEVVRPVRIIWGSGLDPGGLTVKNRIDNYADTSALARCNH